MTNIKPFKMPKGTTHLPVETAVYVPTTTSTSKSIKANERRKRITETRRILSNFFGGYTQVRATGGYVSGEKVITETIYKVTSFGKKDKFNKNKNKLRTWLLQKKKEWGQESIGYEQEGDMYYI